MIDEIDGRLVGLFGLDINPREGETVHWRPTTARQSTAILVPRRKCRICIYIYIYMKSEIRVDSCL